MADIVVRDDPVRDMVADKPSVAADSLRETPEARAALSRAVASTIGVGIAAIAAAYWLMGSVRIETGTRSGLRYRVETIWSDFVAYLVRQGASQELVIAVSALAVISVLGSCLLIGLAFAIRDENEDAE